MGYGRGKPRQGPGYKMKGPVLKAYLECVREDRSTKPRAISHKLRHLFPDRPVPSTSAIQKWHETLFTNVIIKKKPALRFSHKVRRIKRCQDMNEGLDGGFLSTMTDEALFRIVDADSRGQTCACRYVFYFHEFFVDINVPFSDSCQACGCVIS
jgi:hypothetical protein